MKKTILFIPLAILIFVSCDRAPITSANQPGQKTLHLGKSISEEGAIESTDLKDTMGESLEMETKVKGEVIGVCADKTCILQVDLGDGTCMNVKMNNSLVPVGTDLNGKTAIMEGRAYVDTTNVKMLPGYGIDSGRSIAQTEASKDPEVSLAFEAKGLIIK